MFLESAYFNPVSIRKSSKRHTLKTDASFRYERGADPLVVEYAAKRAALLIQELAGGQIVGKVQESYPEKIEKKVVDLDYGRIENFVGKKLGADVIENILESLAYEYTLPKAIKEGYLSPIKALTIPLDLDLTAVSMQNGDFKASDLGNALDPYLYQIAD